MDKESQLIKRARNGDISAFEELIAEYEKKIYNYCFRMTNNREDAEDLAQEVFIKVYRGLKSFKGDSQFSTWIYRIAYNTCVDKFRRKKVRVLSMTPANEEEKELDLPDGEPLPEEKVLQAEKKKLIQECIESLKPEYKTVIILRDIQDHTYESIADILGIPLGTVKSHISRARAALREALDGKI